MMSELTQAFKKFERSLVNAEEGLNEFTELSTFSYDSNKSVAQNINHFLATVHMKTSTVGWFIGAKGKRNLVIEIDVDAEYRFHYIMTIVNFFLLQHTQEIEEELGPKIYSVQFKRV